MIVCAVRSAAVLLALVLFLAPVAHSTPQVTYRVLRVIDGDTVRLGNGATVRLVQIDTPEIYFGSECYGRQASRVAKRLLPPGTRVRLAVEPATDRVDGFGRLLRYVIRAKDRVNVNLGLVAIGAAKPQVSTRAADADKATRAAPIARPRPSRKLRAGARRPCPARAPE